MSLFFLYTSFIIFVSVGWFRYRFLNKIECMVTSENRGEWNYEKGFNLSTAKNEKDAEEIEKKLKSPFFGFFIAFDIILFCVFSASFCIHFKIDPEYSNESFLFLFMSAFLILYEGLISSLESVVKDRLYLVIRIK